MKTILAILCFTLAACKTPTQNERLGQLVNLALNVAERRGVITAQDAADIRSAESIALPPAIESTSGK